MNEPPKINVSQNFVPKATSQADTIEQNGRRDNWRITGVTEES